MDEINDNPARTVATPADARDAAGEQEWRPGDAPALGGNGGLGTDRTGDAWASQEATPRDMTPGFGRPPADPRSFVGPEQTSPRGLRKPPVPSVAAIVGHPLHPMMVPLPIGAFTFALASDVAYAVTGDRFWARASSVLLGAGIATGAAAGALGAIDFTGRDQVREHGESWAHAGGNIAALGLAAVNLAIRRGDPERRALPAGLALSALTGGILAITGWLGGELSYRHRIGVTAD